MNDERPIEKLLRRYAKKRRDDAGAPVELHPATRRMLQGEVARQFPKRAAASEGAATTFAQVLKSWRKQLIWALPVLIVLVVGVWALVGTKEESSHEFDLAKNAATPTAPAEVGKNSFKARETSPPGSPPSSTSNLEKQPALAYANGLPGRDKQESSGVPTESRKIRLGAANDYAQASPADALRNPPVAVKRALVEEAGTLSDEKTQTKSGALSASAKNNSIEDFESIRKDHVSAGEGGLALAPAGKPAAFAPDTSTKFFRQEARGGAAREKTQACSQAFANRAPASSCGKAAKSDAITPVLANFQVEQAGSQLRVIDDDGSTYLGEMNLPAPGQSVAGVFEKKGAEKSKLKRADKLAAGRLGDTQLPEPEGAQNFAYRVAGTNRTLNQQVVFAWNFVAPTNELAAAQVKSPAGGGKVWQNNLPAQQFPLLLNNSVINGRAQLGGTKEIEINAVPVSP